MHPLVGLGVVALVAVVAFRALPDVGLIGWDAFPTIDAAAVRGWADVGGLFTADFLGGYHPYARFLRPLTSATLALDHALHGLEPRGYHVTTLTLHAAAAVALCSLARSWFGRGWAPVLGACLFALHPLHWDTLAYVARRGEVLALLCGCCALIARERKWPGLAACACLLAVLSKETGALFALLVLWRTPKPGLMRQAFWLAGLLGPFLLDRALTLGGAGGYLGLERETESFASIAGSLWTVQLTGGSADALPPALVAALPWIVGAGLLPLAGLAAWRRAAGGPPEWRGAETTTVLGWAGFCIFYAALAPEFNPWYAYVPLAFACVGLARIAELAATELRDGLRHWAEGATRRITACVAVATLACAAAPALSLLHLVSNEENDALFELATKTEARYLAVLAETLDANPPGVVIRIEPSAVSVGSGAWSADRRPVMMLGLYSIAAWGHLTRPEHQLRAYGAQTGDPSEAPGGPDQTAVQVVREFIPLPADWSTRPPAFGVRVLPRKR
jgi:hypothetical protein